MLDAQARWRLQAHHVFLSEVSKRLRYTKYLGDGDSKGFDTVAEKHPALKMKKLECVGQVQKRVGKRLRTLKKKVKGLNGKLTATIIDKLQN